jgi:hypothetical protein
LNEGNERIRGGQAGPQAKPLDRAAVLGESGLDRQLLHQFEELGQAGNGVRGEPEVSRFTVFAGDAHDPNLRSRDRPCRRQLARGGGRRAGDLLGWWQFDANQDLQQVQGGLDRVELARVAPGRERKRLERAVRARMHLISVPIVVGVDRRRGLAEEGVQGRERGRDIGRVERVAGELAVSRSHGRCRCEQRQHEKRSNPHESCSKRDHEAPPR